MNVHVLSICLRGEDQFWPSAACLTITICCFLDMQLLHVRPVALRIQNVVECEVDYSHQIEPFRRSKSSSSTRPFSET